MCDEVVERVEHLVLLQGNIGCDLTPGDCGF